MNPNYAVSTFAGLAAAVMSAAVTYLVIERRRDRLRRLTGHPGKAAGGARARDRWVPRHLASHLMATARTTVRGSRQKHRRHLVATEAPLLLDLLVICADGGMNLHQGLVTSSTLVGGPLGNGLSLLRRDLDLGQPLPRALESLARRVDTEEVRALVRILNIGQALGTPIGESLRQASRYLRHRLRLSTEQRLATVPLKLTLCTVALFMPPIFILLLLPNVLNFAGSRW